MDRKARGVELHVPGDHPTILAALQAAAVGDSVVVAAGTYVEVGLEVPSGLTLRGATGDPADVVIDGDGGGIWCNHDSSFFARSSEFIGNEATIGGAGIYVDAVGSHRATPRVFDDCSFVSNSAPAGSDGYLPRPHHHLVRLPRLLGHGTGRVPTASPTRSSSRAPTPPPTPGPPTRSSRTTRTAKSQTRPLVSGV